MTDTDTLTIEYDDDTSPADRCWSVYLRAADGTYLDHEPVIISGAVATDPDVQPSVQDAQRAYKMLSADA